MSKIMKICDGNEAAAYVAYAFSEVAAIYPHYAVQPHGGARRCLVGQRQEKHLRPAGASG